MNELYGAAEPVEDERWSRPSFIEQSVGTALRKLLAEREVLDAQINRLSIEFEEENPTTCPYCSSALVTRTNKRTQKPFIGCSTFPRCKYSREV